MSGGRRQMLEDFLRLGPTHGFVALTSLENNEPKLLSGFHFDKSPEEARTFIEQRKADWLSQERRGETRDDRLRAASDRDGEHFAFRVRECLRRPLVFCGE